MEALRLTMPSGMQASRAPHSLPPLTARAGRSRPHGYPWSLTQGQYREPDSRR